MAEPEQQRCWKGWLEATIWWGGVILLLLGDPLLGVAFLGAAIGGEHPVFNAVLGASFLLSAVIGWVWFILHLISKPWRRQKN